jgi:DNA topoisomerase-1
MSSNSILVIVESPAKCKKIASILNSIDSKNKYFVKASIGHVRDLPSKSFGININDDHTIFRPLYQIMDDKIDVIKDLKYIASKCSEIILATDLDREGEGIASHLAAILELKNPKRIVFSEITKTAIKKALDNPSSINNKMVEAYETRRLLDRIIGYKLTPVVQKNVTDSFNIKISAGRTQSVVLKLIADKEFEINKFESSGYYNVTGLFNKKLNSTLNNKLENKEITINFLNNSKYSTFTVENISKKQIQNKPPIPFITSSLQQDANNKLKFSIASVQLLAQKLYEQGYITYIRSDCPHISQEFLPSIENYIIDNYGKEYLDIKDQVITKSKKKVVESQDAHECIRPTDLSVLSYDINDADQAKLYDLIWKRTIASQMKNKIIEKTTITIKISNNDSHKFLSDEEITLFKGYTVIYDSTNDKTLTTLNWITKGMELTKEKLVGTEKFTQPPPRYSESSIIKDLEKKGIGRPSTYVASYQTNINRTYIEKLTKSGKKRKSYIITLNEDNEISEIYKEQVTSPEKDKIYITEIGKIVNQFLSENFNDVINYEFTAFMEGKLDDIAKKKSDRDSVLSEFYKTFYDKIKDFEKSNSNKKCVGEYENKPIYLSVSKFGPMLQWGEYIKNSTKPFVASITLEQFESLSLEACIKIINSRSEYPKNIGKYKSKEITICKGPYGLYIKWSNTNFSINNSEDIDLEKAISIIEQKKNNDFPKNIGKHNNKDIVLHNGPYGIYIKYNNKNISIPTKKIVSKQDAIKLISKS